MFGVNKLQELGQALMMMNLTQPQVKYVINYVSTHFSKGSKFKLGFYIGLILGMGIGLFVLYLSLSELRNNF